MVLNFDMNTLMNDWIGLGVIVYVAFIILVVGVMVAKSFGVGISMDDIWRIFR